METIRRRTTVTEDGELTLTDLPLKKGQTVEVILRPEDNGERRPVPLTARRLLESGVLGIWKERTDIGESAAFARQLREAAQNRRGDR